MKKMLLLALMLMPRVAMSQTAPSSDFQNLMTWIGTQQIQLGTASPISGHMFKNTYAASWWDAVSIGQSGLNVGRAGALDFINIGPGMNVATDKISRYGIVIPVHVGNIWNSLINHLPSSVASHVNLASVPNMTVAAEFLAPTRVPISKATLTNDFLVAVGYRFGGS